MSDTPNDPVARPCAHPRFGQIAVRDYNGQPTGQWYTGCLTCQAAATKDILLARLDAAERERDAYADAAKEAVVTLDPTNPVIRAIPSDVVIIARGVAASVKEWRADVTRLREIVRTHPAFKVPRAYHPKGRCNNWFTGEKPCGACESCALDAIEDALAPPAGPEAP